MKKNSLLLTGLFAASFAWAQQSPPHPAAPPPPALMDIPGDYQDFLQRHPEVKNLEWSKGKVVHVYLKSGRKETYHLHNKAEAQKLHATYGTLPAAPPPPPPPPPPAVARHAPTAAPAVPAPAPPPPPKVIRRTKKVD